MTAKEHLEKQQALFKQFAEILDFVLKFDDLKVSSHNLLFQKLQLLCKLNAIACRVIVLNDENAEILAKWALLLFLFITNF